MGPYHPDPACPACHGDGSVPFYMDESQPELFEPGADLISRRPCGRCLARECGRCRALLPTHEPICAAPRPCSWGCGRDAAAGSRDVRLCRECDHADMLERIDELEGDLAASRERLRIADDHIEQMRDVIASLNGEPYEDD